MYNLIHWIWSWLFGPKKENTNYSELFREVGIQAGAILARKKIDQYAKKHILGNPQVTVDYKEFMDRVDNLDDAGLIQFAEQLPD